MGRFLGEGTCFLYAAMEISLIADFFKGLDRQGPGGDPQTMMALELAGNLLPDNFPANTPLLYSILESIGYY